MVSINEQLGNYRLLRLLGRGGFAEVYLGQHLYLKSYAALKVLRTSIEDEDVTQFMTEAQTLARLVHPHIVRVLDFDVIRGLPVLVMEYSPGGTLRLHHPSGSRLSLETTVSYLKQIASALSYAHQHDVIHRDVKPENMLFGDQQEVRLSDFGIALLAPSHEQLSTQEMVGTIPYMAPEQLQGKPCLASDQYALGVVAYEWLCGVRPFEGNYWQLAYQHISSPPPSLREKDPSLPASVEAVVLKALAKDPQHRYASVQLFAQALEQAVQAGERDLRDAFEATAPLRAVSFVVPAATLTTPQKVFLTASSDDAPFAARLSADLHTRGITIWNAHVEATQPADNEGEMARQAIRAVDALLVVVSQALQSSRVVKQHLHLAGIYRRPIIYIQTSGDERIETLPLVEHISIVNAQPARYTAALDEIVARLEREHSSSSGEELRLSRAEESTPRNPYKGLRAFRSDEEHDFFGRDALIVEMIELLRALLSSQPSGSGRDRLLTVIGPSGSGKSSVVMAGLLPRLADGALPGSDTWIYLDPMVPGTHPIEALALTLSPHFPNRSVKSIREDLKDDAARGLHLLTTQLAKVAGQKVVLLVDQFEELFTLTAAEAERQQLIDLLVTAATEPRGSFMLILTLRADFYDRPIIYPELGRLIMRHQCLVVPMDIHELRLAIKQPAALPDVHLTFEGNLVGDVLYDIQGQPGSLPLLQFTLDQLFQRRHGSVLTLKAYQEIGGVKGALAKHAETTYAELPSDKHRVLARSLFLRLIDPGFTEQDTTRRRAPLDELTLAALEENELLQQVTAYFLAARLLTTSVIAGIATVEVSHEALIREWLRLADWLWEAREDVLLQQAISENVAEWEQRGKPRDRLYRGSQLKEARLWAKRNTLSKNEAVFLRASAAHRMRSIVSVMAVLLLVVASIGTTGWFLTHQSLNLTHVTNLQDQGPGSLRQAIDVASPGDTITFDTSLVGTIMLTSELIIAKNLKINGPVARTLSVNSGKSKYRVHVIRAFFVTIANLNFKNSITPVGIIYNEGTLTLNNSTVSGNRADYVGGGGITNANTGTLTLNNSTVSGNSADFGGGNNGGGIFNAGMLTLNNSTVSGNRVSQGNGGGIYNEGTLILNNSTVSSNSASSTGGGIYNKFEDKLTLNNSTVSNNSASGPNGVGGIYNTGMIILSNSTVSGNSASGSNGVGGIEIASFSCETCSPAQAELTFTTIYGNRGSGGADIVINDTSAKQRSQVEISNSIVAGDSSHRGPDIAGTLTSFGYNLFQDNSGATFASASPLHSTDKLVSANDLDRLFASPVGLRNMGGPTKTYALAPGSPAIDAIPLHYCQLKVIFNSQSRMYTDQRGSQRPDGKEGTCDIGAYEYAD